MGDIDLETVTAGVVGIIVDLHGDKLLGTEFTEYIKLIYWLKEDWASKNETGTPEQFEVIRALAWEPDAKSLIDHLRQLYCLHKDNMLKKAKELVEEDSTTLGLNCPTTFEFAQDIAFSLIENGDCDDIVDQETCKDVVHFTLLYEEQSQVLHSKEPKMKTNLTSLYNTGKQEEVKVYLRSFIRSHVGLEEDDEKERQQTIDQFRHDIKAVLKIVKSHILDSNLYEESEACYIDVMAYLSLQEIRWRKKTSDVLGTGENRLPSDHRSILRFGKEKKDEDLLHQLIKKFLKESRDVNAMEQVNDYLMIKGKEKMYIEKTAVFNVEKIASLIGTTLTVGLSTLHLLTTNTFKPAIAQVNISLHNPTMLGWLGIGGVSGVFIAGICIWNAYQVYKGNRTVKEAGKRVIDSILPMAVASLVGCGLVFAFAPTVVPIWLSVALFGAVGVGVNLLVTPLISRFSRWLLYDSPKEQATKAAYKTLNIKRTATDEEVRSAYRQLSRRFHPDMLTRRGSTQQQIDEAILQLFEVQRAFDFILSIRFAEMNQNDKDGILVRIRKFFANSFSKMEPDNKTSTQLCVTAVN